VMHWDSSPTGLGDLSARIAPACPKRRSAFSRQRFVSSDEAVSCARHSPGHQLSGRMSMTWSSAVSAAWCASVELAIDACAQAAIQQLLAELRALPLHAAVAAALAERGPSPDAPGTARLLAERLTALMLLAPPPLRAQARQQWYQDIGCLHTLRAMWLWCSSKLALHQHRRPNKGVSASCACHWRWEACWAALGSATSKACSLSVALCEAAPAWCDSHALVDRRTGCGWSTPPPPAWWPRRWPSCARSWPRCPRWRRLRATQSAEATALRRPRVMRLAASL